MDSIDFDGMISGVADLVGKVWDILMKGLGAVPESVLGVVLIVFLGLWLVKKLIS